MNRLDRKELNDKTWEVIRLYSKASKAGFKIEEIVLFNYMLRSRLLLIIEMKCIEGGNPFKDKWLRNETNELASTAYVLGGIDKILLDDLKNYYEKIRSYLIHKLITEPLDLEVFENFDKSRDTLQTRLQEALGIKIKITEVNKSEDSSSTKPNI
ncbi:hypothetical protein CL638_00335 [bacterium]|nr:hypothetical protein [bacterium]